MDSYRFHAVKTWSIVTL